MPYAKDSDAGRSGSQRVLDIIHRRRRMALLSASAALVALPSVAFAQDAGTAAPAEGIQEIIVTAQKRVQPLQDVSISVTAVGAERLAEAQALNLEDIQRIAPSLTVSNNGGYAKLFMRGIGFSEQTAGIDPSVALHVDGAVVNNAVAQFTSVFDLERIEVLRGPQGTLYGRNATGGAVNLITAKPTEEFGGYARGSYGNYDQMVAEFAAGGPIVEDRILGRAAFRINTHSGYGRNETTGNDLDDAKQMSARGQLKFIMSDDIDLLVSAEWYREDDSARGLKYKQPTFPGYATSVNPRALQPIGLGGFATGGPRNTASEVDSQNEVETWATTATLNWRLNDIFGITSLTNYRETRGEIIEDFDMSRIVNRPDVTGFPPSIHLHRVAYEQFSQELQLNYSTDEVFNTPFKIDGIFAFYYFNENIAEDNRTGLSPVFAPVSQAGLTTQRVILFGDGNSKSYAVFGNATIHFNDQIGLKLGGRFTHESRSIDNNGTIVVANGLGPTIHQALANKRSFSDFTPEIGLEWKPAEDIMLYYTYSEGFKTGAGLLGAFEQGVSRPETIKNHEFGLKSTFLDRRLLVNLAAFSYRLTDLQVGRTIPDPVRGFVTRFENAAKLKGEGIEAEIKFQPVRDIRLDATVAYLDARFGEFMSINQLDPNIILNPRSLPLISLAGDRPRQSPKWSYNLHGEVDFAHLANGGVFTVAGDLTHRSTQFFSEFNAPAFRQGAYTLVDARLTYRAPDDRWAMSVWGKNLGDKLVSSGAFAVSLSRTVGQTFLPPRLYGVTLDVKF